MTTQLISAPTLQTIRIIWGSMFMSLFLFAALPQLIPANGERIEGMLYIFAGLALFDVVLSFVLPWLMFGKPLKERTLPPKKVEATFQSTRIIAFAMSESIGVFGFTLFFLGEPATVTYLFVALAAVTLALHFPRQPKLA